ncbi:glycoside hydrolase family 172 protein [Winogradskyella schleiferi]|uniref:glycoside hydrolase family 172 protein n=1 Tax=Winogradskyella schleiferi TaxID=2686078 RepID=UPI0015BC5102|nr:glycoside hydrolase family 172 protein [Winogradskyella schleiferi]
MKKSTHTKVMHSLLIGFFIVCSNLVLGQNEIWQARDYSTERISSYDKTGANDDGNWKDKIKPNETRTIGDVSGPGIIKHIWMTIASNEPYHLKKITLRMYWDGEDTPSVETPIGDFFGLGLGKYNLYESKFTSVGSQRALNAYFPMPFNKSAKITITNEGDIAIGAFYYNIDWEKHISLPENTLYFHAQYRQQTSTDGWTDDWSLNGDTLVNNHKNLKGEGNYVIMEAKGKGHFLGVTHSLIQNQGDWWGEGDEMIFIDGNESPKITGTGAEDYYLGAWCYGGCGIDPFGNSKPEFDYKDYGNPINGGDDVGAQWTVYRFHDESPVTFNTSIKMTIEHGHANHRSDNYYTVGYWYQSEPHMAFPEMPKVADRLPSVKDIDGPNIGKN